MSVRSRLTLAVPAALALLVLPAAAQANPLRHSGQASEHAVVASGHGSAAVATGAAAVVAVPLMGVGELGKAAGAVGERLWDATNQPLEVTRETVESRPAKAARAAEPVEPAPKALR